MADGKPSCRCGKHKLSQLSDDMLRAWRAFEGERWYWHTPNQAYFRFCRDCHRMLWPRDVRSQNRFCRPRLESVASISSTASGVTKLVCGDLFLTRPVPEWRAAPVDSSDSARPSRSRSAPGRAAQASSGSAAAASADGPGQQSQSSAHADEAPARRPALHWRDMRKWERNLPPSAEGRRGWHKTPEKRRRAWDQAAKTRRATTISISSRGFFRKQTKKHGHVAYIVCMFVPSYVARL